MAVNIISTIPKTKFKTWAIAEQVLINCDGTTLRKRAGWPDKDHPERKTLVPWFWLINTVNLPKKCTTDSVCFLIYDGVIRGYFNIVDTATSESYRAVHDIGKERTTNCIVMANWHAGEYGEKVGQQGWGYTELQP